HLDALAVWRGQLHLGADRRLGERHRHVHDQVVAAALEEAALLDLGDDVEVARLAAARRSLALSLDLDAGAVLDACGDPHLVGLGRPHAPAAAAVAARALDGRARAGAAGARVAQRDEAV